MSNSNLSICLVDDDKIYQFAARKTIEATGMVQSIKSFVNGEEAIHFLVKCIEFEPTSIPDIIFLDINMPIMNGWEFLEAYNNLVQRLPKKVTIYMVSSSVDEYDINKSRQFEEVTDYIIKPVHKERFKQLLTTLVA